MAPKHQSKQHLRRGGHSIFGCQSARSSAPQRRASFKNRPLLFLLLVTLCELSLLRSGVSAEGVFEFELLGLERLDQMAAPFGVQQQVGKLSGARPLKHIGGSLPVTPQPPRLLLHICLKQAFASHLDERCAYGNATLTLNRGLWRAASTPLHTIRSLTNAPNDPSQTSPLNQYMTLASGGGIDVGAQRPQIALADELQDSGRPSAKHEEHGIIEDEGRGDDERAERQSGSQMTNKVKLPFAFRWTKSFTIILTVEQIDDGAQKQKQRQTMQTAQNQTSESGQSALELTGEQLSRSTSLNETSEPLARLSHRANQAKLSLPQIQPHTSLLIDRHVLTENEVLPKVGMARGSKNFWISRETRSEKLAINFKFRVSCAAHYFGESCQTFCRPRDDQFGHYECSATGQRVCFEGWQGKECQVARCKQGCNQQYGFCDVPNTCQCRNGWAGPRCDECIPYPGCQNGYCFAPWQCVCHKNWAGVRCDQDLNYCGAHDPCINNGTCQNVAPARYKCNCPHGFTGANCEMRLSSVLDLTRSLTQLSVGCLINPCLNGGTCYGFNSRQAGSSSSSDAPQQLQQNSSAAVSQDEAQESVIPAAQPPIYRCQCATGWTGDFCQWSESEQSAAATQVVLLMASSANSNDSLSTQPNESSLYPTQLSNDQARGELIVATKHIDGFSEEPTRQWAHVQSRIGEQITFGDTLSMAPSDDGANQSQSPAPAHHQLEMKHLISGVVLASAVGVFCASLLLAWCCLAAIEKGKFHFIQMNFVRSNMGNEEERSSSCESTTTGGGVSSTLRRVHDKIRDSFKRSSRISQRIKPETKLSIENVFNVPKVAPPAYEESYGYNIRLNQQHQRNTLDYNLSNCQRMLSNASLASFNASHEKGNNEDCDTRGSNLEAKICTLNRAGSGYNNLGLADATSSLSLSANSHKNLVKRGALEMELAQKKSASNYFKQTSAAHNQELFFSTAQLHCPKHGHLYRGLNQQSPITTTTIEIEYQPTPSTLTNIHNDQSARYKPDETSSTKD